MRPTRHSSLAAAALTGLLLTSVTACGSDDTSAEDTTPAGASASASGSASDEPTSSPSQSEGGGEDQPVDANAVPVYYVGDTPDGPRLYREFRKVSGEVALGAAEMAASGSPLDPDYRSAFPDGIGFTSVSGDADGIEVVVDDATAAAPGGLSGDAADLAVQSLVYTVQGALQSRAPVTVVDGEGHGVDLFGVDTSDGVGNEDPLDVLALVNVTTPEQGASVSGSFTASGVASSFEANVPWELRDGGDTVVAHGFATAEGWMDKLYPWETEIDVSALDPGSYTFFAMTDDPSGGEGGGSTFDSKQITIG